MTDLSLPRGAQPWATCVNQRPPPVRGFDPAGAAPGFDPPGLAPPFGTNWTCTCDTTMHPTCRADFGCTTRVEATDSLQVTTQPSDPSSTHYIWEDEFVSTHAHAAVLLQFPALPPANFIGTATLVLSKEPGSWPCRQQYLRAYHADFRSFEKGAGVRRMQPVDPSIVQPLRISQVVTTLSRDPFAVR